VNPDTGLIDPRDVERKITDRTKAVIAVHWGGTPCDIDALHEGCERFGIPLIEDAAHAFGATYHGTRIGSNTADFTMFSFQAIKHITTGDGGLLSVRNSRDYRRGKLLRWYGIDRETDRKDFRCEEDVEEAGMKWHMNDLAAVIGIVQLDYIDSVLQKHRENAKVYYTNLDPERFKPAFNAEQMEGSAFWLYTILMQDKTDRLKFMKHMKDWGIATSQVHARNDTHSAVAQFRSGGLPGVDQFVDRMVCIPVHWALTEAERSKILDACHSFQVLDSVMI
jgi:dTDP-4-amino-4,6-dideoxygalactose transaminase